MANRVKHGAKGNMWLKRDWEESSSTHIESFDNCELVAAKDGNSIVLIKSSGVKNFIKTSDSDYQQSRIIIDAMELARLIEKYGRKM